MKKLTLIRHGDCDLWWMGSRDRTLVHLSGYIPSGVASTSETSTVSEELCVARGEKIMHKYC